MIPRSQIYIRIKNSGSLPDPAVYCPAHGYENEDWVPPVQVPDPTTDQILLLCDDLVTGVISLCYLVNTGLKKFELLDTDMNVLYSTTFSASTYQYSFPTQGTGTYYIIRLSPNTAGAYSTTFYRSTFGGYPTNYHILQAKFYTPSITSIQNAFDGIMSFRECIFCSTVDSLSNINYAFQNTGIEKVTFPVSLPALTNMTYTFAYTYRLKKIDWSGITMNALQTMTYTFYYSNVREIVLPSSLPALTSINMFAANATSLVSVTMMATADSLANIGYAFYNCYALSGTVIFPPLPALTTASQVFYYCYLIEKIVFQGPSNTCTTMGDICRNCKSLIEITFPTSLNGMTSTSAWGYWIYGCDVLQKIVLPLSMSGLPAAVQGWWGYFSYVLQYFTTCNDWGSNSFDLMVSSHQLLEFDQPTLRCSRFAIGYSNTQRAKCTSVEIDWVNSSYSGASPQITLRAELDAAELERIFTALPAVAKTITCSGCPGYATADKTIATAKGWTVN
jgi:hypothetical protein